MVILTLQFGQCGNQIGHSLFSYLANDIKDPAGRFLPRSVNSKYTESTIQRWFSSNSDYNFLAPRCVLIDTENKVISSITKDKSLLKYGHIIAKADGGSANNWAFGYNSKGCSIKNDALGLVRKEVEKSDEIVHILNILSSGGGTGSGVGSRIIESLREEYPNKTIVNVVVLPYKNGEIATQSYNTLLTLDKLYDLTDGSILFENDQLHKICKDLLAIQDVDLMHLNNVIAQKIASVLQPVTGIYSVPSFTSQLTSHPSYKFLQIKTTPHVSDKYMKYESAPKWHTLIGHVHNILRVNNLTEMKPVNTTVYSYPGVQYCKSVSNVLITRGGSCPETKAMNVLSGDELYASWLPCADRFLHYHQTRSLHKTTNFLALATNNNSICGSIDTIVDQAWTLFNHKAYLHQYEKYDVTESEFNEAFEKLECVLNNYNTL